MAALLQIWGHDVLVASDGPAALAVAADRRPAVVLLDIAESSASRTKAAS